MKSLIILLAATLLVTSCRKTANENNPAPPAKKFFSVKLNQAYMGSADVDSAFAYWKINGQKQRIRLSKSNDSLYTEMANFTEGTGELTVHVFSNKKYSNQYYGQWVSVKTVSLQKTNAASFNGPSSFYDADWFPRVHLKDAIGHEATIALRPDDAYFLVKDPNHALVKLTVDRGYWKTVGGIQLAGRDVWQCYSNCTGTANTEFFKSLPGRIGTKPWNHISIVILFEVDEEGLGWIIDLEYEP